jgi:hypothetical protein
MAVKQMTINQLSEPDRDKLFKIIKECSDSMTRQDAEKDFVRESIAETSKNMQLPKTISCEIGESLSQTKL